MTLRMNNAGFPGGVIQGLPSGGTYTVDANGQINAQLVDITALLQLGFVFPPDTLGRENLTATTDPGVGNDNTQGYTAGSMWVNLTLARSWICLSSATGAAVWGIDSVQPGVGYDPANMLTLFGGGTQTFTEEGNIFRGVVGAGVGNTADANDDILFGIQLSANSFDIAGRGLCLTGSGKFAANGNTKQAKIIFNATLVGATVTNGVITGGNATGGTVIGDTGSAASNNIGWQIMSNIFKYGANGANTQFAQYTPVVGTTHGGISLPLLLTATESGVINIVLTGKSAASAAADVLGMFFEVNAMN